MRRAALIACVWLTLELLTGLLIVTFGWRLF